MVLSISKVIAIAVLLLLAPARGFFSQSSNFFLSAQEESAPQDPLLQAGEELEYKVSYSIFTLGTIRVRVTGKEERADRTVYKAQAYIDSAPGLP
ncbi:MAG: DUF3108 domain-containing protein, partial [Bacteroidota bacterium]